MPFARGSTRRIRNSPPSLRCCGSGRRRRPARGRSLARPKQFSREDIINAAFSLVRREGRENLSARAVARELGSSTMPIYSSVRDMDEIEDELAQRTLDLIIDYQSRPATGDGMVDFAIGHLEFAAAEPELYKIVYISRDESQRERKRRMTARASELLEARFSADERYGGLDADSRRRLLERTMIFAHGYSTLQSAGLVRPMERDELVRVITGIIHSSL